jgi:diacylglycerol kinase (ATP)
VSERLSVAFLVNPASANGQTGRRWPELAHRAAELGLRGPAYISERPGQLPSLAREAAEAGATLLVAVGGDGTVNEVVNGIVGTDAELAIIPRGTGVDFVRTFAIPSKFDAAVEIAKSGTARPVDLGRATYRTWAGEEASSLFANVASAGMSGAIAKRANETSKALGGKASYLWSIVAVFARWQADEVHVEVDGETRRAPMHDVVVANGRYFGGGIMMCPAAEPDDGLFDVLLLGDLTKRDLVQTMHKTYKGTHLPHPKAELLRGASVLVDPPQPLPIQLDGEQPGTTPVRFEVVPQALRLRAP